MQQVISAKQARQITGGRKPLVPVVYEEAVKALAACLSLDDAKEWDNKADALAAWAKIYQDGKVARQAKALKLRAYERMAAIAKDLRGHAHKASGKGTRGGRLPGARALLIQHGLAPNEADAAMLLAKLDRAQLDALAASRKIPSPGRARFHPVVDMSANTPWSVIRRTGVYSMLHVTKRWAPQEAAAMVGKADRKDALAMVLVIAEWCDAFLQAAGK